MDLLDNYKKAWDNQPEEIKKISALLLFLMSLTTKKS